MIQTRRLCSETPRSVEICDNGWPLNQISRTASARNSGG
jgi:hypothetical protein